MEVSKACLYECYMSSSFFGTLSYTVLNISKAMFLDSLMDLLYLLCLLSQQMVPPFQCAGHLDINFKFSLSLTHTAIVLYYQLMSLLCPIHKIYLFLCTSTQTTLSLLGYLSFNLSPFFPLFHLHFILILNPGRFFYNTNTMKL